jgi:hypothetical protein
MGKKGKGRGKRPEEGASQAPTIPGMFSIFFAFPLPYTEFGIHGEIYRIQVSFLSFVVVFFLRFSQTQFLSV